MGAALDDFMATQEFCEQVYSVLDPSNRGYVELHAAHVRTKAFASHVLEDFVTRILNEIETEVDPSAFVFKEDLVGKLVIAVENEWRGFIDATPPSEAQHSPTPRSPIPAKISPLPTKEQCQDFPRLAKAFLDRMANDAQRRREQHCVAKNARLINELETCTFTPSVGRPPLKKSSLERQECRSISSKNDLTKILDAAPDSGAALDAFADTHFKAKLRKSKYPVSRISAAKPVSYPFSRAYLMHRVNMADKYWEASGLSSHFRPSHE